MLRRFLSYYKPHLGLFTFDMISAVIVSAASLFYPTIVKNIINFSMQLRIYIVILLTCVKFPALETGTGVKDVHI